MKDITFLSATGMAAAIRSRQISVAELIEAHLQQIKQYNQ